MNPYDLKRKLFHDPEESTISRERCKSVTPFEKQSTRQEFKGDFDCNEKRFEANKGDISVLSKNKRSISPDFKKSTKRKGIENKSLNMNTYDVNYEYTKSSLGKVPNFKRYIPRPNQEKEIIYNEYYKPLEQIFKTMDHKDNLVAFRNLKSRDDLLYKPESIANQGRKSILQKKTHKM